MARTRRAGGSAKHTRDHFHRWIDSICTWYTTISPLYHTTNGMARVRAGGTVLQTTQTTFPDGIHIIFVTETPGTSFTPFA